MDNSESMTEKRLARTREGLAKFIRTLGKDDRGALISFTAYKATMKEEMNGNKKQLCTKLNKITIEKAPTKVIEPADTINAGLEMAVNHLTELNTKHTKLIVLFVDGDMRYN